MLNSKVKVSYLSEEELMKARIGAKCDLENRFAAKKSMRSRRYHSRGEDKQPVSRGRKSPIKMTPEEFAHMTIIENMTYKDISQKFGVSQAAIAQWKRRNELSVERARQSALES